MIKVTFAGVPIQEQNISWSQTTGVEPSLGFVIVPLPIAEQILSQANPVSLIIHQYDTKISSQDAQKTPIVFSNLYIINHSFFSEFSIKIHFADVRWLLQGKKVMCAYNLTLLQNGTAPIIPTTYSAIDLKRLYNSISIGRYVSYSVKDDGTPYTLKEIIEIELKNAGVKLATKISVDMSYIVENIVYDGIDLGQVLNDLLRYGRLQMSVTPEGTMYVYSLSEYEDGMIRWLQRQYVTAGRIFISNKKRARPRSVKVRFKRKMEVLCCAAPYDKNTYGKTMGSIPSQFIDNRWVDSTVISNRRAVNCYNVIPLPFEAEYNGETFLQGKYVPVEVFLEINHMTLDDITKQSGYYSQDVLITTFMAKSGEERNPTLEHRCAILAATLKEHFRQTYMIDPYIIPHIESWETTSCTIVSTFDNQPSPSTVWGDYCHIGTARNYALAKTTGHDKDFWKHSCFNHDANDGTSPAALRVVNHSLGIFKISYATTSGDLILPTKVGPNVPIPCASNATVSLIQCYPTENHTLAGIISVVYKTDMVGKYNSPDKYYTLEYFEDGSGGALLGESTIAPTESAAFDTWEIHPDYEYARYQYYRPMEILYSEFNTMSYTPLNKSFLTLSGSYEAGNVYNTFKDLYAGSVTLPTLAIDYNLSGNLSLITWLVSPTSVSTIYNFVDAIPYPTLESKLPQKYIDLLRKQIDKGGAPNELL